LLTTFINSYQEKLQLVRPTDCLDFSDPLKFLPLDFHTYQAVYHEVKSSHFDAEQQAREVTRKRLQASRCS
jgi:hypothetical protein